MELVYFRFMMLIKDTCNCCYFLTQSSRGQEPMMFSKVLKRTRTMNVNCSA